MLATSVFLVRDWHRRCFSLAAMNLNSRLKKLREDKKQIIERLRQEEAKASTRQRKAETRAKIIWGAAVLSLPEGEREALTPSLFNRMSERDRRFITEHQANTCPDAGPPSSDLN